MQEKSKYTRSNHIYVMKPSQYKDKTLGTILIIDSQSTRYLQCIGRDPHRKLNKHHWNVHTPADTHLKSQKGGEGYES